MAELTGEMAGQSVTLIGDDIDTLAKVAEAVAVKLQRRERYTVSYG